MAYKNLGDFKKLFNREDFNYISNPENLKYLINHLSMAFRSDEEKNKYILFLKEFKDNLGSFYNSIRAMEVKDIQESCSKCNDAFNTIINLLTGPAERRRAMSNSNLNRFKEIINGSLKLLFRGIRDCFDDPDLLVKTAIDTEIIIPYMFDKFRGKYLFNSNGRFNIFTHVHDLNRQEVLIAYKKLKNHDVRRDAYWDVMGDGPEIRIVLSPGTKKIYRLYKQNEHDYYQYDLRKRPSEFNFVAA